MTKVSPENLILAARQGHPISFPTDTVPALATLPERAELIYQTKQRSQAKPLILMGGDMAELWQYAAGDDREIAIWQAVADCYLPGALTLVLPASDRVPAAMNPLQNRTIGLRVPNLEIARSILRATGALATTSANLSGQPALLTMAEIDRAFPDLATLDLDLEIPSSGRASTVVQWTGNGWQILRQGAIDFSDENDERSDV